MKTKEEIQESATKIIAAIQDSGLWLDGVPPSVIIALSIEHGISMRMGLGDAWEKISPATKREIRSLWREIAKQVICAAIVRVESG